MRLQDKPLSERLPSSSSPSLPGSGITSRCCSSSVMANVCSTRYHTAGVPPHLLASEADRLRSQLKDRLLSSYFTIEWQRRVPPQLSEGSTTQAFAQRFLTDATTHLSPDMICLWLDLVAPFTDVHMPQRPSLEIEQQEKVEKVTGRGATVDAVVLPFTWERVGPL